MASDSFDLQHAALDSAPEAVNYSLEADDRSLETEYSGTGSTEAAAPAVDSAKIIYTANLTLESKDYEAARSALDSALPRRAAIWNPAVSIPAAAPAARST